MAASADAVAGLIKRSTLNTLSKRSKRRSRGMRLYIRAMQNFTGFGKTHGSRSSSLSSFSKTVKEFRRNQADDITKLHQKIGRSR